MNTVMKRCILAALILIIAFPVMASAQVKMIKILVSSPFIGDRVLGPIADVMAGSIIRELNRIGGIEIINREQSEKLLSDEGFDKWIADREMAVAVGKAMGADIVIYSTLSRNGDYCNYSIAFLEVEKDVIQRLLHGTISVTDSPSEIGRNMKKQVETLARYIPQPSELIDPGEVVREKTVDPVDLPDFAEIENLPRIDRFGYMEQVYSYYKVFPGEIEWYKFEQQKSITRFTLRDDMDQRMNRILNEFDVAGDFAIRHNMQAYFIQDCSLRAINVLLANKIPVFCSEMILVGYSNLRPNGFCLLKTVDNQIMESYDLTHRERMAVMIILPKPGRRYGISRDYLEKAIGLYNDEWGKTPTLREINDSMFDIIATGLE